MNKHYSFRLRQFRFFRGFLFRPSRQQLGLHVALWLSLICSVLPYRVAADHGGLHYNSPINYPLYQNCWIGYNLSSSEDPTSPIYPSASAALAAVAQLDIQEKLGKPCYCNSPPPTIDSYTLSNTPSSYAFAVIQTSSPPPGWYDITDWYLQSPESPVTTWKQLISYRTNTPCVVSPYIRSPICAIANKYVYAEKAYWRKECAGYALELSNDPAYPPTVPAILPAVNAKNKVLTRARLDLVLKRGGQPAPGRVVPLQSDRGTLDTIQQPPATDAQGKAKVSVDTRDQPGPSKITDNDPEIETVKPGIISWLPAKYESDFGLTCYSTELETDYKGRMKKASDYPWCANQLPPASHYQEKFMKRIIFQGSGQATGGEIIQYKGCYHVSTCPRTASTECAQVGTTIAVARKAEAKPVVPFKSTVDIDQLGTRRAHDTGSTKENRIYGYRIDVYNGSGLAVCRPPSWGDRNARVKLLKY